MAASLVSSLATGLSLNFEARDGKVLLDGAPFFLKGINWYGTEHKLDHTPTHTHTHALTHTHARTHTHTHAHIAHTAHTAHTRS